MLFIDRRCARGRTLGGILAIAALLAGCGGDGESGAEAAIPTGEAAADSVPYEPREPVGPATDLPPNEVGEIMVLEYHRLGTPEGEFYRSLENFRADLQRLYDAGFRPVTVRQLVEGDLDVPRGTTPVVFTVDDSSEGQFYLLPDGTVDPNTMVGVWEAFRAANPGWEGGATWCVLPGADYPSNFFGERPRTEVPREEREQTIQKKIDFLVERGHEICNHTLYHARLDRAKDDVQVQEWIGRGEDSIQVYLPDDYRITTLALPLGRWPENRALAWRGSHGGNPYEYLAVLEVTGGPSPSPFDGEFNPLSIPRVPVAPGHLERRLDGYVKNPWKRHVSDGDIRIITVPESEAARVDVEGWPDRELRTHDVPLPAAPAAPEAPPATEPAHPDPSRGAGEGV